MLTYLRERLGVLLTKATGRQEHRGSNQGVLSSGDLMGKSVGLVHLERDTEAWV